MYAFVDVDALHKAKLFWIEAKKYQKVEAQTSTPMTTVTTMFLGLGNLAHGKDHAVLRYSFQVASMGFKLGSFGVSEGIGEHKKNQAPASEQKAFASPTWGFSFLI